MSEEAKKKVATAATQAKHAIANVEDAAELQAEEVVQAVVTSAPVQKVLSYKVIGIGVVLFSAGVAADHFGHKAVDKLRERKVLKETKKRIKTSVGEDGEASMDIPRRSIA